MDRIDCDPCPFWRKKDSGTDARSRSRGRRIAEGHGRFTYKDQLHFCIQSRGSLSETYNHLIDALDCTYINQEQLTYYKNKIDETERLLNGYIAYLRKSL